MEQFDSNAQYFEAVTDLTVRLESEGHDTAALEIREGMACINGLTDGWGQFLEAIEAVQRRFGSQLDAGRREELQAIRRVAHNAVYRR